MKKQNYFSALTTLILSLACLFVGFYVGNLENQKTNKSLIEHLESQRRSEEIDTKNYIDLLALLKKGETDKLESFLTHLAMIRLNEPLSPRLKAKATEYQNTYCEDRCL